MTISIAMTSYNGERFIREQLASFVEQKRRPDELVVCDDHSTDGTADLLHEFAKTSPFPVRVVVNEKRLGIIENFEQAVRLCTGDIIFLSDHDDFWHPEKLASHEEIHESEPDVGFVFSNALVCDEASKPRGFTLFEFQHMNESRLATIAHGGLFDLYLRSPRVNGCTMSFRASLRDTILPIPSTALHDAWFCLLLSALTQTRYIERPLMHYRIHAAQATGIPIDAKASQKPDQDKSDERARFLRTIDALERYIDDALRRLRDYEHLLYRKDAVRLLEGKLAHVKSRRRLANSLPSRIAALAGEMLNGRYLRYSTKGELLSDVKRCLRAH
jgi:glycosyltransferase involved in cell wall biosynthesis